MLLGSNRFVHRFHRHHASLLEDYSIYRLLDPAQIGAHIFRALVGRTPLFGARSEVALLGKYGARNNGQEHASVNETAVGKLLHTHPYRILRHGKSVGKATLMRFRIMDTQPFYILYLHQAKAIINDLQATLPRVTLLIGPIAPESGEVEPFPRREQSVIHFIITSLAADKFEWRVGCHVLHAVDDKDVGIVRHIIEQRLLVLSCKPVFACQAGIEAVAIEPSKSRHRYHRHQ